MHIIQNNILNDGEQSFWQRDLSYKNQLITNCLHQATTNKMALSRLDKKLQSIASSTDYQRIIAKLDSKLSDMFVQVAIHSHEPNIAPLQIRSLKQTSKNPWSFNYTRWYSDTVYQKEKEYTRAFYQTDGLISFITNSGMSAFNLALNVINSYLEHHQSIPYYIVDSNTYGECLHLLSQSTHRAKVKKINFHQVPQKQLVNQINNCLPVILVDCTDVDHAKKALSQLHQLFPRKIILMLDITRYPDYLMTGQIKKYLRSSWIIFRFGSLSKYHYAGLGIGRAGVLTMRRAQCAAIFDPLTSYSGAKLVTYCRALTGGALEPYQAAMIPSFSLIYIKEKVLAHYRNAYLISRMLIDNRDKIFLQSYDPSTDSVVNNSVHMQGFCLFVSLKDNNNYHSTVSQIITELSEKNIVTEERGSFGFRNTTFDIWADKAVRISDGCEEEPVTKVIAQTILQHLLRQT